MRVRRTVLLVVFAATVALTAVAALRGRGTAGESLAPEAIAKAPGRADADARPAAPDEVIVRFTESADGADRGRARAAVGGSLERRLPLRGLELLELQPGASPRDAVARLAHQPGVEYAEPNWSRHALASVADPLFPSEWGLHNTGQTVHGVAGRPDADIDAPEALTSRRAIPPRRWRSWTRASLPTTPIWRRRCGRTRASAPPTAWTTTATGSWTTCTAGTTSTPTPTRPT
jgi:hypothetical protein